MFTADSATGILIFAFVSVSVLVLAIGALFLHRDRKADRLRMITMRKDELDRLQNEQTMKDQAKKLRQRMQSRINVMRAVLERFRLQRMTASKELKLKLAAAGLRHPSAPITFVFSRFAFAIGGVFVLTLFTTLSPRLHPSAIAQLLMIAGAAAAGYVLPALLVKNATLKRQQAMTASFPDMLDMLVICVEGGVSIASAFSRVTEELADSAPVLSREIALLSAELTFLGDRRAAYTNFADRTGLPAARNMATTLNQSERYGTPIGVALKVLAKENRSDRMTRAEKKAAALPAQLSVPMIVFFMPALFLVMLGPPLMRILVK